MQAVSRTQFILIMLLPCLGGINRFKIFIIFKICTELAKYVVRKQGILCDQSHWPSEKHWKGRDKSDFQLHREGFVLGAGPGAPLAAALLLILPKSSHQLSPSARRACGPACLLAFLSQQSTNNPTATLCSFLSSLRAV